ncbi:hypothetical protein [Flavobacterium caseinilyticum]|uniref:EF-hand domain-containing protein n=1 Tax=Flavobacterium caseinilyticum TaxID=2541732 RepID=A0A4R5AU55_9FLAO|nr:hypothetical protein [Flavobacterium caseinilyticum]TDD75550.1 hypothetical protein E0F89_11705 [Flavobacterium caseinilyticum]
MFEQLIQLTKQFGYQSVVTNSNIPNEQNEAVINETTSSIFSGLQKIASEGAFDQLASLFQGNNAQDTSNPVVQKLIQQLSGNLGEKFGLAEGTATGVAGNIIPKILGSLIGKAKDPNDSSFQISDVIAAIAGNSGQNSSIMDAISKYGVQFGLDKDSDGKVDACEVIDMVTKNSGGLGGLLGKLFGK